MINADNKIVNYQALTLRVGLSLMAKGIKPNREWTWKSALLTAGKITGETYKNKKDAERAREDLRRYAMGLNLETIIQGELPQFAMISCDHWDTPKLRKYFTKAQINSLYLGDIIDHKGAFYTALVGDKVEDKEP